MDPDKQDELSVVLMDFGQYIMLLKQISKDRGDMLCQIVPKDALHAALGISESAFELPLCAGVQRGVHGRKDYSDLRVLCRRSLF